MSVIEKILALMEERDISARKLTSELGLANSSISEWKKGKARPSLEAVVKIAGYFGVTTDYLLLDKAEGDTREVLQKGQETIFDEIAGYDQDLQAEELPQDAVIRGNCLELRMGEDKKLLECYYRLDERDREYILCKMIVLQRESVD